MRNYFYFLIAIAGMFFLLTAGTENSGGSQGAYSGSPGDGGATCTNCHTGGTATPQDGWITTNIPGDGYTPGETYTITATGTHSGVGKFGFEVTAEDNTDSKTGTFVISNPDENKLTNDDQAVTHKAAGTTPNGDMRTWTFDWIAPAVGTGDVTFYGAFNAANGNGNTMGDVIYTTNSTFMEHTVGVDEMANQDFEVNLYPNPFTDFIKVSVKDNEKQISSIQLFNQSGSLVKSVTTSNAGEWKIDASDLNSGMYFVVLESFDNSSISKSVIKL